MNEFYSLEASSGSENRIEATVRINPSHDIFEGHFPGNPVLPGVCIILILKKIIENHSGSRLMMVKASSIKYIAFVDPMVNPVINFTVDLAADSSLSGNCTVHSAGTVFCKLKADFSRL